MCRFLIHQCHLPISFRSQPSPSLLLITPSEQPIMRFLIWQTGCIIYAELIRHKTHGWISWGILLFHTSAWLNLFKHSVFLLFLSFFCSIVLENGTNSWKEDNVFVAFRHSVYSEDLSNIIKWLCVHVKFFSIFLTQSSWKDNPFYFFLLIFLFPVGCLQIWVHHRIFFKVTIVTSTPSVWKQRFVS